ncbi:MAG: helix-hairpin-helix domain-containing protein [Bacteroidota bacterium]
MKPLQTKYFEYTRAERLGVSVLLLLGVLLLVFPSLLSFLFPKEKIDFSAYQEDIAVFEQQQKISIQDTGNQLFAFDPNTVDEANLVKLGLSEKAAKTFVKYRNRKGGFKQKEEMKKVYGLKEELYQKWLPYIQMETLPLVENEKSTAKKELTETAPVAVELFAFDPNTVTEEELKKLGVPKKMRNNLLNYREAGATFQQKEDIKRLYSFTEKEYDRIADYIVIEPKETLPPIAQNEEFTPKNANIPSSYDAVVQPKVIIDINKATAEEWQQLRGIGPAYANRIVKFRTALGGFSSVDQISETYNLPDSTFQKVRLSLRPSPVFKKLKINELTAAELKAHPYINWKTANIIVNYRKQHGAFSSIEDLRKIKVLAEDWLKKMEAYFEF